MIRSRPLYRVRRARAEDIPAIIELCKAVYPDSQAWSVEQLESHQRVFPEGQMVAVSADDDERVVGMASSLIMDWDDYESDQPWREFTSGGLFTNHNPEGGKTLYGAEIMVHPGCQGTGVGKKIYKAREDLVRKLGLLRIRAGARLRGYHLYAREMTAHDYVMAVVDGKIKDPTLTFQIRRGFHVLRVVEGYLRHDPESLGYAALIEWINPSVAKPSNYEHLKKSEFYRLPVRKE